MSKLSNLLSFIILISLEIKHTLCQPQCYPSDNDPDLPTLAEGNCRWPSGNGTFDLCDWNINPKNEIFRILKCWEVWDSRNDDGDARNWTYIFNVGNNIRKKPNNKRCWDGTTTGYCPNIPCNSTKELKTTDVIGAAYQIARGSDSIYNDDGNNSLPCHRLHDGVTNAEYSFIDPKDPTVGIQLRYINGDYCPKYQRNREFILQVYCSTDSYLNNVPDGEERIFEYEEEKCHYYMPIKSPLGCPTECPILNGKLCADKGRCDFDFELLKPKCFCFSGYYGDDCTLTEDNEIERIYEDNNAKYIGGLVIILLLLLLVVFILGYLFIKKSKLGKGYIDNKFFDKFIPKQKKKQMIPDDEYDDDEQN